MPDKDPPKHPLNGQFVSPTSLVGRFQRFRKWFPVTVHEDDSEYDGPFSTYPEAHAATIGFGYGLAVMLALVFGKAVAFTMLAATLRAIIYAHTGKELTIAGRKIELPARYLRQIRREPHYLVGGVGGGLVGGYVLYLVSFLELPAWVPALPVV